MMADADLTRQLNSSEDNSRLYQTIQDNTTSRIQETIAAALSALGGSEADIFRNRDARQLIRSIDHQLPKSLLNIKDIQSAASHKKSRLKKVNVNEETSLSDLNQAILSGRQEALGPAYYYRGLILMSLEEYKPALHNLTEALVSGFSEKEEFKVHHKAAQCCLKLKQFVRARDHLQKALTCLGKAKLKEQQQTEYSKILTQSLNKIADKAEKRLQFEPSQLIQQQNQKDSRLSQLVVVESTTTQGRYAVAAQDIPPGTVLALDEGIGPFLNPDDKENCHTYCLRCLRPLGSNPFPCYSCSSVFCCATCREEACSTFHKINCDLRLADIRQEDNKSWCKVFSSLNILSTKSVTFWLQHKKSLLNQEASVSGLQEVRTEDDRYQLLFSMVTHEEEIPQAARAKHGIVTVLLLRSLRQTSYYSAIRDQIGPIKADFSDAELSIGEIIYRLRLITESNCHPLWGVEAEANKGQASIENIGSGVYPSIGSYINSNCDPNTIRCNIGNAVLLIASKTIKKGEEISDNYCIHYSELPVEERGAWLEENFFFRCRCQACSEAWGVYDELPASLPAPLRDLLMPLEKEIQLALSLGNIQRAVQLQCDEIRTTEKMLDPPHTLYISLRNSLQSYWWSQIARLNSEKIL